MQSYGLIDGRKKLLALRALKLGDLLVAVPAIKGLRRAYPEHALVLAMPDWLSPIVRLVDGVDALLPTPALESRLGSGTRVGGWDTRAPALGSFGSLLRRSG